MRGGFVHLRAVEAVKTGRAEFRDAPTAHTGGRRRESERYVAPPKRV